METEAVVAVTKKEESGGGATAAGLSVGILGIRSVLKIRINL